MADLATIDSSATSPQGEESEAFQTLRSLARGKAGAISPDLVAQQALAVTVGADFPVQREALEALLRRFSFARRDAVRIATRPARGAALGSYRTNREGSSSRPYSTQLHSLEPLAGSCDCPDFGKSSLGLCKHLLAILEDLSKHPRKLQPVAGAARLVWDPIRPLTGAGDWLDRVRWVDGAASSLAAAAVSRWFKRQRLKSAHPDDPARRAELVRDLLRFVRLPGSGLASDAALLPLLTGEQERLARLVAGDWVGRELTGALKGLKLKLYPYQLEGVRRFLRLGRLLLADDMGLGKTAQAIASCHALFATGRVRRGLLLVPAALKPQWQREWQQFSDAPIEIVDGGPAERAAAYLHCKRGFLLANYEQVLRDLPLMHRFRPDLVVLDEAQRIKNWATKTSAYVRQLRPPYRLVLTGTPMENRLEELATLTEWVDELALEPKWRLGAWHSTWADGKREVTGARNLDTLRERLAGCMLRRTRGQVLTQLPKRTDTRIPVPLTPEQQGAHDELNQPIASLVGRAKKRPLTQAEFLKLMSLLTTQRVICNGLAQFGFEEVWPALEQAQRPTETVLRGLFSPKLLELQELIANVAVTQRRKVVVFSQWRRMLKLADWAVSDVLEAAGARAVFFTGEEKQKRRTQNLVDFHDDPDVRVLFASDAGGVGLNLQKAASCCINLELPWNPAVLEQRIGRIYRMGQSRPVEVYHLVSEPGIEARIAGLVGSKQALFTGLFDGASDEVQFERSGSFLSRIEQVLAPVVVPPLPDLEDEPRELELDVSDQLPPEPAPRLLAESAPNREPAPPVLPAESAPRHEPAPPQAGTLRDLFSQVEFRPGPNGRVTFEAPAEAAAALSVMFEGMAKMFAPRG